jgi:hypothetical protein
MPQRAIYYPYIHVDVNWLKGTLLFFDRVSRMIPPEAGRGPKDDSAIDAFRNRDLLVSANLLSRRVEDAQTRLAERFRESGRDPRFLERYGLKAMSAAQTDDYGFQIHRGKTIKALETALYESGLAFVPSVPEPYDPGMQYFQVHPTVGQVIMSTLAITCAEGEGLDIVGDRRSGTLHRTLLEKDLEHVYDALLSDAIPAPEPTSARNVFEFLVASRCDLTNVSPEALASLDREPLQDLMTRLREAATAIPTMDPGPQREADLASAVSSVLTKWHEDRKNLQHYWRQFWGDGASDPAIAFFKTLSDKTATALGASGGIVAASAAHVALATLPGALFAATGALVVGIGSRVVSSYANMVDDEKKSRYRYLTTLEDAGVTFLSADAAKRSGAL